MTYKKWEYELKCLLQGEPKKEVEELTRYYAEIYGDKKDAGYSDEDILIEFGTPEECAEKFRAENAVESGKKKFEFKLPPADKLVKLSLLTIFVYLPLACVILSAIATVAGFAFGGAGIALGGVASVILSFVHLATGNGAAVFLSMLGLGLAAIGAGALIAIAFFYATKYSIKSVYKIAILIYEKIKKGAEVK